MQRLAFVISGLCAAAMMAASAPQAVAMPEAPAPRAGGEADESWDIVPEDQLQDLRGGIDLGPLVANFAIQRVVEVDGIVVARMQIVISNLGALGNGGMPTVSVSGPLAELVQIMNAPGNSGNTGAGTESAGAAAQLGAALTSRMGEPSTPALTSSESPAPQSTAVAAAGSVSSPASDHGASVTSSSASAGSLPATGTSSAPAQSTTPSGATAPAAGAAASPLPSTPALASTGSSGAAPAGSAANSGGSAASAPSSSLSAATTKIIPVGTTGQVVVLSNLPNATAITTAVQNDVSGIAIQTQTTISATLNSLSLLNAASLATSIRQQIAAGH